jgi:hypothetical protein
MALILDGTNGLSDVDGSAATPAIRGSDANTGVFFGTDIVGVSTGGTERMHVDASGNVGIGTSSPTFLSGSGLGVERSGGTAAIQATRSDAATPGGIALQGGSIQNNLFSAGEKPLGFYVNSIEYVRLNSDGVLLVGKSASAATTDGVELKEGSASTPSGLFTGNNSNGTVIVNRQGSDGTLIALRQANSVEGTISVSGTTVSYNGGHLSRWAQTLTAKDESLVKGTVLSNLDEMNVYTDAEGNPVENEQLNKVKVSDVEGDANVAGVFVNWEHDEAHNVDEINMAMTGDMIIRIAQGVTVQRGDLLMSAGDGTAKPQGDDIVRSKTIAKVTSTHVTCTYADGSFCVPCVLMAC